jgi:hypothetical protein
LLLSRRDGEVPVCKKSKRIIEFCKEIVEIELERGKKLEA